MSERLSAEKLDDVRAWTEFITDPMATATRATVVQLIGHIDAIERDLHAAERGLELAEKLADAVQQVLAAGRQSGTEYPVMQDAYKAFRAALEQETS